MKAGMNLLLEYQWGVMRGGWRQGRQITRVKVDLKIECSIDKRRDRG